MRPQRRHRLAGAGFGLGPGTFDAEQRHQRRLARRRILAHGLAGLFGGGGDIQKIVGDLKDHAHFFGIVFQAAAVLGRSLAQNRSRLAGELEQLTGLEPLQFDHVVGTEAAVGQHVDDLAPDHTLVARRVRQAQRQLGAHLGIGMGGRVGQDTEGQCQKGVTRQHRRHLVKGDVGGGTAPAQIVVVHAGQIVMHQAVGV